jgi:hypothetical protein
MSLTPSTDDPNRKAELERAKKDPLSFGPDIVAPSNRIGGSGKSGGLVPAKDEQSGKIEVAGLLAEYLARTVKEISDDLANLDDEQLLALREAEANGKSRIVLLAAIDKEISLR